MIKRFLKDNTNEVGNNVKTIADVIMGIGWVASIILVLIGFSFIDSYYTEDLVWPFIGSAIGTWVVFWVTSKLYLAIAEGLFLLQTIAYNTQMIRASLENGALSKDPEASIASELPEL